MQYLDIYRYILCTVKLVKQEHGYSEILDIVKGLF